MFARLVTLLSLYVSCAYSFKHRAHLDEVHITGHRPSQIVKFGANVVDVDRDLMTESGENLLAHHHRSLGSMAHDTIRSKLIYLPDNLPRVAMGEVIGFDLFDDIQVLGKVEHVIQRNEESVSWTGSVRVVDQSSEEDPIIMPFPAESEGHFGLTCHHEYCVANVVVYPTNQEFLISPSSIPVQPGGRVIFSVSEIKLSDAKRTAVTSEHVKHVAPDVEDREEKVGNLRATSLFKTNKVNTEAVDSDLIMDSIVFYTAEAVAKYAGGSNAAMEAKIYLANDQANTILFNSAIRLRYRVVGTFFAGANFTEPTTKAFGTSISWLTDPKDGKLDQAQTLRDQYGADSVFLVIGNSEYCGVGWLNTGFNPNYAYAVYNGGCLYGSVWAHEIGHNMGCYHDRFSDASSAKNLPTYPGFGSCWEDASKNDCTCYSSVMIYQCNTTQNHCTKCSGKNYYANYLVQNSGNPTGTPTASCGLWIDQNRLKTIAYRPTTQPGGMINFASPNYAIASSCALVNISGWQISTTGNDIISVTIGDYAADIVQSSTDWVIVRTPRVVDVLPTGPVDVVVTTSTGRVTTLKKGFTFFADNFRSFENFKSQSLPTSVWSNNGTIPWSFKAEGNQIALYKDGGLGSDESFYTRLLWKSSQTYDASKGGCSLQATSIAFNYKAYSSYSFCYDKFTMSIQQNYGSTWTQIWKGVTGSNTGATPWRNVSITLPAGTTAINIFANTAINTYCRWWAPVLIANLTTSFTSQCDLYQACGLTTPPTAIPTLQPTSPTATPSERPTANPTGVPTTRPPTRSPSASPTRSPTTARPTISLKPTLAPSLAPTTTLTVSPSVAPTFAPSASPTTLSTASPTLPTEEPTADPTMPPTTRPSQLPTTSPTCQPTFDPTASPTEFPTESPSHVPSASPSEEPSASPTADPTQTPTITPTLSPTSNPTNDPSAAPTNSPTTSPSSDPTANPTWRPSADPSATPTVAPTGNPTQTPSFRPTASPSTTSPSARPTTVSSTASPTRKPTAKPTIRPTQRPTAKPSFSPTRVPTSAKPSTSPTTRRPTRLPTTKPKR